MIRTLIFGSGQFGLPSFSALASDQRFTIVGVVTQPDRPHGRHHQPEPTAVKRWAVDRGLPIYQPVSLKRDHHVFTAVQSLHPDVAVVADYGQIIPSSWLELPRRGCINIHGSLLPKYRGASPVTAAILNGDTETGVTCIQMDAGLDTGPIISAYPWPIAPTVTALELEEQLAHLAGRQIADLTSAWVEQRVSARPQSADGVSSAPKVTVDDGKADWTSAASIERKIRALTPWPGVWTTWQSHRVKLLAVDIEAGQPDLPPGTIIADGQTWKVACRNGWVVPTRVHFSGKQPQPAERIPGSYPGFIGSRFAS